MRGEIMETISKEKVSAIVRHFFETYLKDEAKNDQEVRLLKAMRPFLWSAYLAGIEKGLILMTE